MLTFNMEMCKNLLIYRICITNPLWEYKYSPGVATPSVYLIVFDVGFIAFYIVIQWDAKALGVSGSEKMFLHSTSSPKAIE